MGVATTGTSSARVFGRRRRTRVGFAPWKRKPLAVVEQFPRQAEQERGGFAGGLYVRVGRAGFERGIHVDGEAAAGVVADLAPRPA